MCVCVCVCRFCFSFCLFVCCIYHHVFVVTEQVYGEGEVERMMENTGEGWGGM